MYLLVMGCTNVPPGSGVHQCSSWFWGGLMFLLVLGCTNISPGSGVHCAY